MFQKLCVAENQAFKSSFDQEVMWNVSESLWKPAYAQEKNPENGVISNFVDQSVTGSGGWKLMLDKLNLEIRSNFLAARTIKHFPGKMVD